MADYLGLVIALAVGLPLLVAAVWFDARRRRELEGDAVAPPQRGDAAVDAHMPTYLTQSEVADLPLPSAGTRATRQRAGTEIAIGHALPDFATHGEQAELAGPRILMVDGEITSIRELLAILSTATEDSPLVIVARGFAEEVLATLQANRRALGALVVAARASQKDLYELAAMVGGEVLEVSDLKAGYTPLSVLGSATNWTSNLRSAWVEV